jgi:cysteinyl-tRNA synthetase
MIAGARVEVADNKRDPMDFVLWKPSAGDQPGWESPWGYGRPGWHIECSAMAKDILGDTFDIHGGGNDLMFPHHENEIAQSCCASGHDHDGEGFANYWLHNEMLQVEGKKMSKSLGNFFTVRDLLDGHDGQAPVPGEVIRFVFLSTHYRKPMDWTQDKADQAAATLHKWRRQIHNVESDKRPSVGVGSVYEALCDDLNTSLAIARLHELSAKGELEELYAGLKLMGFSDGWHDGLESAIEEVVLKSYADKLSALRTSAMETKDFAPVDALKTALLDAGIEVRMSKTGVELEAGPKFDPAKLEGLL